MYKNLFLQCIFLSSFFVSNSYCKIENYNIFPKSVKKKEFMKIKILDVKVANLEDFHELSALAYKNNRLYALSDKGVLYLFDFEIKKDKIKKLVLRKKIRLRNSKNKKFKKKKRDSEGLALYKDGFLISFERKNRILYCSRNGKKIKKMAINPLLEQNENYQRPNKGLEGVVFSKKYGIITSPELPLKTDDQKYHTLYSKKRIWKFKADASFSDLALIDDHRVVVLLRKDSHNTTDRATTLIEVDLDKCNSQNICKTTLLAKLDSKDGWRVENFEGITKIEGKKFLMVSDDNDDDPFQKTLFLLFELRN